MEGDGYAYHIGDCALAYYQATSQRMQPSSIARGQRVFLRYDFG